MKATIRMSTMAASALVGACASSADSVAPAYVSPLEFNSFSCDQLTEESARISSRLVQVAGMQDEDATRDAVATGVGVVLFWPALFFLAAGDHEAELGRLKGEYEAIERAATRKNCVIAGELRAAREAAEAQAEAARSDLSAKLEAKYAVD